MKIAEKRALEVYPIESHEMYDDMYRQRGAYVKGYEKGYQEAQVHTIDKACEWLLKNTYKHVDDSRVYMTFTNTVDMIEDFRRTLLE